MHELAQSILQYDELLNTISDICGELDSLLALAQGAKQYKLVRPRMTKENVIRISGGRYVERSVNGIWSNTSRHILQELTVAAYVANYIELVGGAGDNSASSDQHQPSSDGSVPPDTSSQTHTTNNKHSETPMEGPSMLLMTGPNYSGKSVYLKQTALIVYMAHVGR